MTTELVMQIGRDTIFTTLWVVGPILAVGFVMGLAISLLQAVMQLHEMTLAYVPKIIALGAALILFGHWMLQHMMTYTQGLLGGFPSLISR